MDLTGLQEVLNNIDTSPFGRKLPPGIRPSSTKTRLRKKLATKKKQSSETGIKEIKSIVPIGTEPSTSNNSSNGSGIDEHSLFNMLNQVNQMLKQNPSMVKKVSSCVNNIFENKELFGSIVSQIEKETPIGPEESDSESSGSESVQVQSFESKADELD